MANSNTDFDKNIDYVIDEFYLTSADFRVTYTVHIVGKSLNVCHIIILQGMKEYTNMVPNGNNEQKKRRRKKQCSKWMVQVL